jgi:hypothetical protein
MQNENKSSTSQLDRNRNTVPETQSRTTKQNEQDQQPPMSWDNLVHGTNSSTQPPMSWDNLIYGTNSSTQPSTGLIFSEPIIASQSTPRKQQQPSISSEEETKPRISSSIKQKLQQRTRQIASSSSSDTDSVVEHALHRSTQKQSSPSQHKQPTPPLIPPLTLRQDSQATLIDENLDDLSSQIKQVFLDQERQTLNTDTKEERTTDGLGSMSFPLSTPDIFSTNVLDNDTSNRPNDNLFHHLSNQQRNRHSTDIPERTSLHRKKAHHHHHHHHHQKSSSSRHTGTNAQKSDVNIFLFKNLIKLFLFHF